VEAISESLQREESNEKVGNLVKDDKKETGRGEVGEGARQTVRNDKEVGEKSREFGVYQSEMAGERRGPRE